MDTTSRSAHCWSHPLLKASWTRPLPFCMTSQTLKWKWSCAAHTGNRAFPECVWAALRMRSTWGTRTNWWLCASEISYDRCFSLFFYLIARSNCVPCIEYMENAVHVLNHRAHIYYCTAYWPATARCLSRFWEGCFVLKWRPTQFSSSQKHHVSQTQSIIWNSMFDVELDHWIYPSKRWRVLPWLMQGWLVEFTPR